MEAVNGIALFDLIRYRQHDERVFMRAFDLIELNGMTYAFQHACSTAMAAAGTANIGRVATAASALRH